MLQGDQVAADSSRQVGLANTTGSTDEQVFPAEEPTWAPFDLGPGLAERRPACLKQFRHACVMQGSWYACTRSDLACI